MTFDLGEQEEEDDEEDDEGAEQEEVDDEGDDERALDDAEDGAFEDAEDVAEEDEQVAEKIAGAAGPQDGAADATDDEANLPELMSRVKQLQVRSKELAKAQPGPVDATLEARAAGAKAELASLQAQIVAAGGGNSSTHMNEYKRWVRAQNQGLPADLLPIVEEDPDNAFNLWLRAKGDKEKMRVLYERKNSKRTTVREKTAGIKLRDLEKIYDPEKLKGIIPQLKQQKRFYYDPLFPKDEDEIYFVVPKGVEVDKEGIFEDSSSCVGGQAVEDGMAQSLLEGAFSANSHPDIGFITGKDKETYVKAIADGPVVIRTRVKGAIGAC